MSSETVADGTRAELAERPVSQMLFVIQQIVTLGLEKFREEEEKFKSYLKVQGDFPSKKGSIKGFKIIVLSVMFFKRLIFVASLGYSFAYDYKHCFLISFSSISSA